MVHGSHRKHVLQSADVTRHVPHELRVKWCTVGKRSAGHVVLQLASALVPSNVSARGGAATSLFSAPSAGWFGHFGPKSRTQAGGNG